MKITPKLVRVHKKSEKRDENREKKALAAARLEKAIKTELLDRLKKVTLHDMLFVHFLPPVHLVIVSSVLSIPLCSKSISL